MYVYLGNLVGLILLAFWVGFLTGVLLAGLILGSRRGKVECSPLHLDEK